MERVHLTHPIDPVYDENSEVLILGSFPSVKSREAGFFYGHPQNRFWKVTAALMGEKVPETVEDKKAFLLRNHIALWDVIGECTICGSSDMTIKDAVPNDLSEIIKVSGLSRIFVNGKTAEKVYRKYQERTTGIRAVCLPSTSPANAAWNTEKLAEAWRVIRQTDNQI